MGACFGLCLIAVVPLVAWAAPDVSPLVVLLVGITVAVAVGVGVAVGAEAPRGR